MNSLKNSYILLLAMAAGVRLLVGLALWLLAAHQPGVSSPHDLLGVLNGWVLAPDAALYHDQAMVLLDVWHGAASPGDLSLPAEYLGYPVILAWLYWLAAPHHLVGIAVNAVFFLITGVLAFKLMHMSGQSRSASLVLALVICLWPPSLSYSSTLLKDSLYIMSVFMILFGLIKLMRKQASIISSWAAATLVLFFGVYLLLNVRPMLTPALTVFFPLAVIAGALLPGLRRNLKPTLFHGLLVVCAVAGGIYAAGHYGVVDLALPKAPAKPLHTAHSPIHQPGPVKVAQASVAGLPAKVMDRADEAENALWRRRIIYFTSGGLSLVPFASLQPTDAWQKAVIYCRSAVNLFLRPFPWSRWPYKPGSYAVRWGIVFWNLLWYLALPGIFYGLYRELKKKEMSAAAIMLWVGIFGLMVSTVVVNQGTLFRQRDMAILPLLIFFDLRPYAYFFRR
ncbi:MAG: hypothetical protein K9K66_05525 [Desulfarculaceae bacterium]|nr:hypothetical protein [Desulfarculaceae bacterium]MCF8072933.1 hypothetical protein [Desulfarculaceae bacterium]MCF8101101.1 hypothetical protein [Desulfarculaceae bacterium]MCF8115512.1 hypothetical protein [Desulfarculaceae bacterium]